MNFLIYLIAYPILWLISMLPFRVLYLFSDFIYIIIYRIVKYRKQSVRRNLALALPHLSDNERTEIEKKFYSHLCDMFLEMIKTMTITDKEINERFIFKNLEVYHNIEKKNKSIVVMIAHLGFENLVPGGFGVTMFFFVSGFLITRILVGEQNNANGAIDLKGFYIRRFLRLMPALLAFIVISWVLITPWVNRMLKTS